TASNVNLLISGKLLRYGSTRAPPARISSVETLSATFNKTGISNVSGSSSIAGMETMFGPFTRSTFFASSLESGAPEGHLLHLLHLVRLLLDRVCLNHADR